MLKTQREMKKWSMEQKKTEASFRCSFSEFPAPGNASLLQF